MSWELERRVVAAGYFPLILQTATSAAVPAPSIPDSILAVVRMPRWAMRLATIVRNVAALASGIAVVITLAPKKEMIGPYARPDIATVKDAEVVGDSSEVEFPREAMRADGCAAVRSDGAIVRTEAAIPQPARLGDSNALPEALDFGSFLRCHALLGV